MKLLNKLEGIHTIDSIMKTLNVKKDTAIDYISRLRKLGYVKTKRMKNKRIYYIEFENKLGGESYIEHINKYSKIKLAKQNFYKVYGKKITDEEALIYALQSKNLRAILASLILFKRINNWKLLYKLAKEKDLKREIGALYDLSKTIFKIRRMNKNYLNNSSPKKNEKYKEIIKGFKSKDFINIEDKWKVYLPFNKVDLEEIK